MAKSRVWNAGLAMLTSVRVPHARPQERGPAPRPLAGTTDLGLGPLLSQLRSEGSYARTKPVAAVL